jgi:hypothetical protein
LSTNQRVVICSAQISEYAGVASTATLISYNGVGCAGVATNISPTFRFVATNIGALSMGSGLGMITQTPLSGSICISTTGVGSVHSVSLSIAPNFNLW